MRKLLMAFILTSCLSLPALADDTLGNKITAAVKLQGTVVGEEIVSAAILDDIIVREGDVVLVDAVTGHLIIKLGPKEIGNYPADQLVTITAIATGEVVVSHCDTSIKLIARP